MAKCKQLEMKWFATFKTRKNEEKIEKETFYSADISVKWIYEVPNNVNLV